MQPTKFGTKISVMEITRHKTRGRSDRKSRMERLRIVFEIIRMIKDIEIEPLEKTFTNSKLVVPYIIILG